MPGHFRGPIIVCHRDDRGCVVLTQADQLPLQPQRPPREWLWFSWGHHIPISQPRLGTPEFIQALEQIVQEAAATYSTKTGQQPRYVSIQTPGRILGHSYHLQGDGTFGTLAGLRIIMDTKLHMGQFGLAADLGSAPAANDQQEKAAASAPPSAAPEASPSLRCRRRGHNYPPHEDPQLRLW